MKPGPAISTFSIRSSTRRRVAIASARSRGLAFASLARTIAALVAISPWLASRGGSTTTRDKSIPAGQLPSAASLAQIACTRASTSAKRWRELDFSAMRRRLTQFRGRVKKPLVLGQCEAVGHAGDEIADPPRPRRFALVRRAVAPFARQVGRRLLVAREKIDHDIFGLTHDAHHAFMAVHVLFQERLDAGLGLRNVGRERDQLPPTVADIIGRLRLR